jgi:hypothetical protein
MNDPLTECRKMREQVKQLDAALGLLQFGLSKRDCIVGNEQAWGDVVAQFKALEIRARQLTKAINEE